MERHPLISRLMLSEKTTSITSLIARESNKSSRTIVTPNKLRTKTSWLVGVYAVLTNIFLTRRETSVPLKIF